jgi:hypothetical protein
MQRLGCFWLITSLLGCGGPSTGHPPAAAASAPATYASSPSDSSGAASARPADEPCVPELTLAPEKRFTKLPSGRPDAENDSVAVVVGETLCLDAREAQGKLVDFHMAGAGAEQPRAMKVQLTYRSDVGYTMMITNPRSRTMRYNATLFIQTQNGISSEATSTVPVLPGIFSVENWPAQAGQIAGIILHHFELAYAAP